MRPNSAPLHRKPSTEIEKKISQIWTKYLGISNIGLDDNFFEMGGDSLVIEQISSQLSNQFNLKVTTTDIYQYPTIALLAKNLFPTKSNTNSTSFLLNKKRKKSTSDIAIIGMAGRFPGAKSISELWEVLSEGKEAISFFKPEEIDPSIPDSLKNDPQYVKARGIIPSAKTFDANFFGINQKLAEVMDPQIRLFLEIVWEVLEENGYLPEHYKGSIGVYAGTGSNSYYKENILPNKELMGQVGRVQARSVNEDFIATRTAYHLNLNGPAVTVQSACSTSLLAISEAVEALRNGHCDVALAGGSSVTAPIHSGHLYQEGSILSSDGHCRSFDSEAKGTIFSDGAGVVLLKNLDLAEKDGDIIHGIIRGIGINNDGGNKGSFSAPNSEGQAGAISKALFDANVNPSDISYIEAHGTATPLGDPIEIKGLNLAFGEQKKLGYCALGSIKSNLGHLTAAAGVTGLIKTILSIKHRQIPPSLGFNKPNPAINFDNSPFYVNTKLNNWESKSPRIAGVSSFGIGGTNVHVIVEEYNKKIEEKTNLSRPLQLLTLSAKTENSLIGYKTALGDFIQSSQKTNLADVAYSLSKTRASFNNRSFIVAKNINEVSKIFIDEKESIKTSSLEVAPNEIGFLFPGQGSQFLQMGKSLYDNESVYKNAVDQCAELLIDDLKLDIREIIFPKTNSVKEEDLLKDTRLTQPALFVTEYALSQLWISWGIKPTLLCGHSIGEFVAAHLAGVFNLKDALHLIATRGRLIGGLPSGSMVSVRLSENDLKEILPKNISIAAINSKHLCVAAGTHKNIEDFTKILESKEIPNRILITSHAFHSSMMNPILEDFEKEVKKIKLNVPKIPIVSSLSGKWIKDSEVTSTSYWVNHLRNTVRFADAMNTILELDNPILLEVGPGKALTTLAHQQGNGKVVSVFPSLVFPKEEANEYFTIINTLGELWLKGINPDWNLFYASQDREKISLPSYVFDRKPCWIEPIGFENLNNSKKTLLNSTINKQTEPKTIKIETDKNEILLKVLEIIKNVSGNSYQSNAYSKHFLELGLDSLTLTQVSLNLKKEFNLPISFRQLNEDLVTLNLLADYLVKNLPQKSIESSTLIKNFRDSDILYSNKTIENPNNQQQVIMENLSKQIQFLSKQIEMLQKNQTIFENNTKTNHLKPTPLPEIDSNSMLKIKVNDASEQDCNTKTNQKEFSILPDNPPVPGAKLGRDKRGNPAWFVPDTSEENKFIMINL